MMRSLVAGAALLAALLLPSMASAQSTAYARGNINMRAGPGTEYPVVATIGSGSLVNVYGCIRGYSWCDVRVRNYRGWVFSQRLEFAYRGRRVLIPEYYQYFGAPIIRFDFGYWDRYYRDRPFFRDRGRWDRDWRGPGRDRDRDDDRRDGPGRGDWDNDGRGRGDDNRGRDGDDDRRGRDGDGRNGRDGDRGRGDDDCFWQNGRTVCR